MSAVCTMVSRKPCEKTTLRQAIVLPQITSSYSSDAVQGLIAFVSMLYLASLFGYQFDVSRISPRILTGQHVVPPVRGLHNVSLKSCSYESYQISSMFLGVMWTGGPRERSQWIINMSSCAYRIVRAIRAWLYGGLLLFVICAFIVV